MSVATLRVARLTPNQTGWSAPPLSCPSSPHRIAQALAGTFVAGAWQVDDLVDRGEAALGRRWRWLRPLAHRLVAAFGNGPRPTVARVVAFLRADDGFLRACGRHPITLTYHRILDPVMKPAPGVPSWPVPSITTPQALAAFLGLEPSALDWFADVQGRERRTPDGPRRHYRYRWHRKPNGSARLIEAPKPRLRALQRRLLDEVLGHIPPHEAAHGFRPGRSIRSFAAPHVGRDVVLTLDLRDFFATISVGRVAALWRTVGYPDAVAQRLAGLCTNRVPLGLWKEKEAEGSFQAQGPEAWRRRRLYEEPHLPQGAPTSPALANLAAFRLDARLAALAESSGAAYTRYADDLAFSGGEAFARAVGRFPAHVGAIALEDGFAVQPRKTRIMRRGVRQRIAGVVTNQRLNVERGEFDRLKATLWNCARSGPGDQNRDGHDDFRAQLLGRIAHVAMLNPDRGRRLRDLFDRIVW